MLVVAFFTNDAVPLTAPSQAPTVRIRRADTGALVVTDAAMTNIGDGLFAYDHTVTISAPHTWRADGDPTAAGQVTAQERYVAGSFSNLEDANEAAIPVIANDTGNLIPAQIAGLNDPTAAAIASQVWSTLRSAETTAGSFGNALTLLLNAIASRAFVDFSTNPWQERRYVFDEASPGDSVVWELYDLYDQTGAAIFGSAGAGNNPLADPTIYIAERRRV